MSNNPTINDINPVYAIEDNIMLLKSGSIAVAYEVDLSEIYTLHLDNYVEITDVLTKTLYSLVPENTVIQFQYIYTKKKYNSGGLKTDTFLQTKTASHFSNRNYLEQKCYVYFISPDAASYKKTYSNFSFIASKKNHKIKFDKIEKFVLNIEKTVKILSSYDYFDFKKPTENELEIVLKNYFKFGTIAQTDLIKTKTGFSYGKKEIKIYSVCDMESLKDGSVNIVSVNAERSTDISKFYRPYAPFGLELFGDHIVNLVIYYDDQNFIRRKLETQIEKLNGARLMGRQNLNNAILNQEFLDGIEAENKKIVRFHYSILTWDENKELLDKKCDYIESSFNKMGITPYTPTKDVLIYLLGSFPGNADQMPKEETILTYDEYPFLFFNPESNYRSDKSGTIFNDRLTQLPVLVDTFDKPYLEKTIDNRNFLIIAPSGGGKSFLAKNVLRQFIEEPKTKTVVINIGGDDKIANAYKDDSIYYLYVEGKPLNVNPFYIHSTVLDVAKIEFLIDFIAILWKNGEILNHDERSSLERLLIDFYKTIKNDDGVFIVSLDKNLMNIKGFYSFLNVNIEKHKESNELISFDSLKLNLEKYAIGTYSSLFEQGEPTKLDDKKYIEFELDNIKDHPMLFPIFGMLISDLTFSTIWKQDGSKKMFFIDEAWKVLEKPGMAQLLKYLYKTIRKFTGSVGIAVQQITDIPDNELGRAIIGNTGVKYILNHSAVINDIPILKERLGLSEREISLLLSVRNNTKGKYPHSEFLLVMGKIAKVLRLEVCKEAFVIYESDKDTLDLYNQLWEKHQNIEKTVEEYLTLKN